MDTVIQNVKENLHVEVQEENNENDNLCFENVDYSHRLETTITNIKIENYDINEGQLGNGHFFIQNFENLDQNVNTGFQNNNEQVINEAENFENDKSCFENIEYAECCETTDLSFKDVYNLHTNLNTGLMNIKQEVDLSKERLENLDFRCFENNSNINIFGYNFTEEDNVDGGVLLDKSIMNIKQEKDLVDKHYPEDVKYNPKCENTAEENDLTFNTNLSEFESGNSNFRSLHMTHLVKIPLSTGLNIHQPMSKIENDNITDSSSDLLDSVIGNHGFVVEVDFQPIVLLKRLPDLSEQFQQISQNGFCHHKDMFPSTTTTSNPQKQISNHRSNGEISCKFAKPVKTYVRQVGRLRHTCKVCKKSFKSKKSLNSHMQVHRRDMFSSMKHPQEQISSVLRKHRPTKPIGMSNILKKECKTLISQSTERPHQCYLCDKTFKSLAGRKYHVINHTCSMERPHQCYLCDKKCKSLAGLKYHVTNHSKERPHQYQNCTKLCKVCGKNCQTLSVLKQHMITHSTDRPHQCRLCDKTFKSSSVIKQHMITHTTKRPHQCNMCEKRFKSLFVLKQHMRSHSTERPHECNMCDKRFKSMYELRQHLIIHSTERPHQCKICDKGFKSLYVLKQHLLIHSDDRPHQCDVCDKGFKTAKALKFHMATHSPSSCRPYQCTVCKKGCKSSNSLRLHMAIHCTEGPAHCTEGPYHCHICDKTFKLARPLCLHMLTHSDERPFQCNLCDKSFKTATNLKRHAAYHSTERPHKCHVCEKGFKTVYEVKQHMITHSTERNYQCNVCGKLYKTSNNLREHITIIHNTERPHVCSICEKRFRLEQQLSEHVISHSIDAQLFHCNVPLCDKIFKKACYLKRHLAIHSPQYECNICGKFCSSPSTLKSHLISHSTEKPHACSVCGETFKWVIVAKKHMLTHFESDI